MDVCKKLHIAKRDEAAGILLYNKIKDKIKERMPEREEDIRILEKYISDEYDHLQGVEQIMKEMGCNSLTPTGEICIIAKEIYGKANEMEKIAKSVEGDEGKKIHNLTEEIEHKVREIDSIVRNIPMEMENIMEAREEKTEE